MANPIIGRIVAFVPGSTVIQQAAQQALPAAAQVEAVTVTTIRQAAGWVKALRANLGM